MFTFKIVNCEGITKNLIIRLVLSYKHDAYAKFFAFNDEYAVVSECAGKNEPMEKDISIYIMLN